MLPNKRPRPDDPPPTADQFRSSLPFGRKAFPADDDNDEDETTGHIVREEPEAEVADVMKMLTAHFPVFFKLQPLPAADCAYHSVARHPWYPELDDFLRKFVDSKRPQWPEARRRKV
jgi:hypothetical protein